jgi:hypothetical protein
VVTGSIPAQLTKESITYDGLKKALSYGIVHKEGGVVMYGAKWDAVYRFRVN